MANLAFMSKATTENDKNLSTKIVAATFKNEIGSEEVSGERFWRNYGYFDARKSDYSMEKVNFPENSLLYINQSYLTVKKKKKFYCDFFMLRKIVESSKPPQDVSSYTLRGNEGKMVRSKCDSKTSEFKGLYETIGYLVVRGSPEDVFFNYGCDKEKSKVLYSHTEGEFQTLFLGSYSAVTGT